jgi:hypothetical protein
LGHGNVIPEAAPPEISCWGLRAFDGFERVTPTYG